MSLTDHPIAGPDVGPGADLAVRAAIVPEGYLLTTRFLRYSYVDDLDGCSPGEHAHPEHVMFWPERGTAAVVVDGVRHRLSVGQGLWVPAGVPHAATREPSTTLATLHVLRGAWEGAFDQVRAVSVNAALRELLLHLSATGMPAHRRLRAQRVCLELIADDVSPVIELPLPRGERIAPIARAIAAEPADARSLEDWAWEMSASVRTLARAFRTETGMTFSQWRTAARMSAAVRLLGEGMPVGIVSRRVGYATMSAFSAAFRRVMGTSPRQYHPISGALGGEDPVR